MQQGEVGMEVSLEPTSFELEFRLAVLCSQAIELLGLGLGLGLGLVCFVMRMFSSKIDLI